METAVLGVALAADVTVYERFKVGDFNVPKAVTIAKKEVDGFGGLYGLLTEGFTHDQFESTGRGFRIRDGLVEKSFVPRIYEDDLVRHAVSFMAVMAAATLIQYGGVWLYRHADLQTSHVELECDSDRSHVAYVGAMHELARMQAAAEAAVQTQARG